MGRRGRGGYIEDTVFDFGFVTSRLGTLHYRYAIREIGKKHKLGAAAGNMIYTTQTCNIKFIKGSDNTAYTSGKQR